jgi:hypothetical protein
MKPDPHAEEEGEMASRRTVELSWGQQHELEAHRDHDPRPYVRERCAAVLKIAEKLWRWLPQDVLTLHRLADDWPTTGRRLADDWHTLRERVNAFLDQFAAGSHALLRYTGLIGDGHLAYVLRSA